MKRYFSVKIRIIGVGLTILRQFTVAEVCREGWYLGQLTCRLKTINPIFAASLEWPLIIPCRVKTTTEQWPPLERSKLIWIILGDY